MIKPSTVSDGHSGTILQKIQDAGFRVVAMKFTRLTREQAGLFYEIHKERPFYSDLVAFM